MTHVYLSQPLTAETVWPCLLSEAKALRQSEPLLERLVQQSILAGNGLHAALGYMLSDKLTTTGVNAGALQEIFASTPDIGIPAAHDLLSVIQHDPAAHDLLTPFLFFKGFHALQSCRVGHWLWGQGRKHLALHLQSRISAVFGVDIHPAAVIGQGIMMDHATGIVIGETTVVEDDVLFWHGVTLGGREMIDGDRHPKVRRGAQLGAGASILGLVEIGAGARVAAGSVVLEDVPAGVTVAGIPARIVSR